jgi:hypothetical protein
MDLLSTYTAGDWERQMLETFNNSDEELIAAMEAYQHVAPTDENKTIRSVFESVCKDLEIGPDLAKRIISYQLGFVNKDDQHVKFFGGHLTGVQVVRFTGADKAYWFEDILGVDEEELTSKLLALPHVNQDFIVSSDTMNISCAWLVLAIFNSYKIPDDLKHKAIISTLLVLQYKFLTSRLYVHFKYPADPAVAEAAYAQLTRKFDLKQYGSWGAVLNARAENIISHDSIHLRTLQNPKDFEQGMMYFLNDTQTRIRDRLKNIANVHYNASRAGNKISTLSSVIEIDGKESLRDRTKSLTAYTRYINSIITDKNSFVREELLLIIEKAVPSAPPTMVRRTLDYMSDNYRTTKSSEVEEVIKEALVHSFEYLAQNSVMSRNSTDLPNLLVRLKGVYTSARSTDPVLLALREKTEAIVKLATGTRNATMLSPVRTSVLLYIVLRALTMKHYTNTA